MFLSDRVSADCGKAIAKAHKADARKGNAPQWEAGRAERGRVEKNKRRNRYKTNGIPEEKIV